MKKVLLIATYDSFLRAGLEVAKNIDNVTIDIYIRITVKNQLSKKQMSNIVDTENIPVSQFYLNNYKNIDFNRYDIIIVSAANSFCRSFFEFYQYSTTINRSKITTISMFPGVIFGDINSIVARINADILLCNNKMDLDIAVKICKHFDINTSLLQYGFPVLRKVINISDNNVYFFEQVKIPENFTDRMYLLEKLIEYAHRNPTLNVYIKPRVTLKERTVHLNRYPMELLAKKYQKKAKLPENIFFTYEDSYACLEKAKLVITISSTVAFEAMYNNIPVAIISDFGLKNEFANKDFIESGCMISFDELGDHAPKPNQKWYEEMILFPEDRKLLLNHSIETNRHLVNGSSSFNSISTESKSYMTYIQNNKQKKVKLGIIFKYIKAEFFRIKNSVFFRL